MAGHRLVEQEAVPRAVWVCPGPGGPPSSRGTALAALQRTLAECLPRLHAMYPVVMPIAQ